MKERILEFLRKIGVSVSECERNLGWSNSYISKMNEKSTTIKKRIDQFLAFFPQVNRTWLETGEGEMLKNTSSNYQNINGDNNHVIGCNNYISESESNTRHVIGCKEGRIINCDLNTIYNMSLEEYCLGEQLNCDPSTLLPNCTYAYQICSRELEPYLLQGDWICIKKVSIDEVRHDSIYLVDTINDGKMIKRVSILGDNEFMLKLPIPNRDYPVITRHAEDIHDFYELVSRIQNSPSIVFNQPSIVQEVIKNNSELLKLVNQTLDNNTLMLKNIQMTLESHNKLVNNQEKTLEILAEAVSKIKE